MDTLKEHIYLDHNATSVVRPAVLEAMRIVYELPLNGSSVHLFGQHGKKVITQARENLADFLECLSEEIIFTSGGTESNNAVLANSWDHVFISSTEHDSIARVCPNAQIIPVKENGIIDFDWLEEALQNLPKYSRALVSIQYANNETGVVQPLKELTEMVHRHGAVMHSDAVQAFGKIPISFKGIGVDFMSICAHKVGGPQGIGALIAKRNTVLRSFLKGGEQERNRRAGTENVAGIAGFGMLPSLIDFSFYGPLAEWHKALEKEVKEFSSQQGNACVIVGESSRRLPNTTCVAMPGVSNTTQLMQFDLHKVAVSTGSACSSGTIKPSYILHGMKLPESVYSSAIRVSTGWTTQESDLLKFVEVWRLIFTAAHSKKESA